MNKDYSWCSERLIKLLPIDWNKCVFSLLIRDCIVDNKKARSKEFQCKCMSDSTNNIIDLASYYENDYDMQDIMFEILDFWYDKYKNSGDNFIIFKLFRDGSYEIKKFSGINNDIDNKIIINTVNKYLMG